FGADAVEGSRIELVQRSVAPEAIRQVRVGDEHGTESDEVCIAARQHRLAFRFVEPSVDHQRPGKERTESLRYVLDLDFPGFQVIRIRLKQTDVAYPPGTEFLDHVTEGG